MTKDLNLQDFIPKFLFANTPNYVFFEFRRLASLKEFIEANSDEELAELFNSKANQEEPSLEDVVTLYCILVGLFFMEKGQQEQFLNAVDVTKLDWGESIVGLVTSARKTFTRVEVNDAQNRMSGIMLQTNELSQSSSSTQTEIGNYKPTVSQQESR